MDPRTPVTHEDAGSAFAETRDGLDRFTVDDLHPIPEPGQTDDDDGQ